ncbi:MAG: hypothetical protein IKO26_10255 [Paludibacteraceae bacterium]|nr:hypothetical protein [Paludibacteraceae bacterium]
MRKEIAAILCLLFLVLPVGAENRLSHYATVGLSAGAAIETSSSYAAGAALMAGPVAGLSAGYALQHRHFLFHTRIGASFRYLDGKSADYTDSIPSIDSQNEPFILCRTYSDVHESKRSLHLSIPLMAGGQWKNFYFLAGPVLNCSLYGANRQKAVVTSTAVYESLYDPFANMPNHGLGSEPLEGRWETLPVSFGVHMAIETGWIFAAQRLSHSNKKSILPDWRLALYADTNLWRNTTYKPADTSSIGVRLSVWLQMPRHYYCHCL